jgi:hypothetical protein
VSASLAFAISIAYAALGNAAVYILLRRRKVPIRFIWSGTPGYLYGICHRSIPPVPRSLTRFALSTNVALLLAIASGMWFAASEQ